MEEITVSAKTLDDAITEALVQLGVTSDQLDYDVIEKGSAGFFGIGMKQAVIKARRKITKREIEEPVIDFSDAVKGVKESSIEDSYKENKHVKDSRVNRENKDNRENRKKKDKYNRDRNRNKQRKEVKPEVKQEEKLEVSPAPIKEEKEEKVERIEKNVKPVSERKEVELAKVEDATVKACEEFLNSVMAAMGMEVTLTSVIDEEGALNIEMNGDNMGILIGKRGQTLDSLQYLTNRVANKMQNGYVRVKLDTEDYRRRRKETLENLAKNIAHKVRKTRRAVSLEPMNPYERRIIHSALQGEKNITTHSEGEEPYRRVVVTLVRRS
ncbi:MAG: KH domain-containing protein [Dorea sp.]|nr:KH domain-containing protein [Dorea sp.]